MTGQGPFLRAVVALVYCFLLSPLAFVVLISFSADSFIVFPPSGWSTRWYAALARHAGILEAFRNSLVVSSIVAKVWPKRSGLKGQSTLASVLGQRRSKLA